MNESKNTATPTADFRQAHLTWEEENDLQQLYEVLIYGTEEERKLCMDVVSFVHHPILVRIAHKASGLRAVVIPERLEGN